MVYRSGYHDHANSLSMIGCTGPGKCIGYLTWSCRYRWGLGSSWFAAPNKGSVRLMLPLDRRYRSWRYGGASRTTRGARSHVVGRQGEPCGVGHGVTPFGGNDTANGAYSGSRWDQLSRASCKATEVVIPLLDHLRLERQWPSNAVEILPRRKKSV